MPLNEREIADYLLANPQFFERHAELLASVTLLSPHGNRAVSLQERQMDMLRDKNKQIERRLAELLRYGHENDGIAARFTRWTSRVLAERDPHALPATVTRGLLEVFDVPFAALRLWDVAETYSMADFSRYVGEEVRIFANSLATPYCGANTGFEAAQWLTHGAAGMVEPRGALGAEAGNGAGGAGRASRADGLADALEVSGANGVGGVHSASSEAAASIALVALRHPQREDGANAFGLLVMGSPEARRFHEGMGTDFLSQIGSLASAALSRLLAH
ncbi:DUF484 family protein [Pararobbsia alpina]|uniref:DUF484 family protein n=1 Tax=Pararobbsia alpina TaxID=621374 RepID=A0A6S7AW28_9BURK|nr:DUF484 family protein [Pararobbsia alpina]CAB3778974.1 hypothetical protein LMG28138_00724 [Pararobbsia alpina]